MLSTLRGLVRRLLQQQGNRVLLLVALSVLTSLTAGAGLALLLPLLSLLGLDGTADSALARPVLEFLHRLGRRPGLGEVLLLFAGVSLLQALSSRFQAVEGARLAEAFTRGAQARLFRAFQEARWEALLAVRASEVLHAATVDLRRANQAVRLVPGLGSQALLALVYLGMAATLAPGFTFLALAAAGALLFLLRHGPGRVFQSGDLLTARWRMQTGELDQYLEGFRIARCYGAAERHRQRLEEAADQVAALQVQAVARVADGQMWFRSGAVLLLCGFVYAAIAFLALPVSRVLVLVYIFSRVVPLVSQVEQQLAQVLTNLPALSSLEGLVEGLESAREDQPRASAPPMQITRGVTLERVSYEYPGREGSGVRDLSLEIPAGAITALVGPSGSGKSTTTDLLLGLVQPSRGRICVDGRPLSPGLVESWRAVIGYVAQETWLFHDTIRANLVWTSPEADEEALWTALDQADAGFVRDLPEGLETVVGDRGTQLSGGERQRLALARAFLRRPGLLVLDEPTSSLDAEAEARVLEVIRALRGRVTVLVVTHRSACARLADRVYRLEEGRTAPGSADPPGPPVPVP